MTGEVILELRGVHTYYGKIHALQGIDLDVREGEIVTLIGSNGAGKTTTLKTISGLLHPREGTVRFAGQDVSRTAAHDLVRDGIAHAPEGRRIFSRLTVTENLQMGGYTRKGSEIAESIERVYALFPRLRERAGQKGGTLSGGEQQMLAIGRAIMTRPKCCSSTSRHLAWRRSSSSRSSRSSARSTPAAPPSFSSSRTRSRRSMWPTGATCCRLGG